MSFLETSSRYKSLSSGVGIAHNKTVAFGTTETTMSKWMVAGKEEKEKTITASVFRWLESGVPFPELTARSHSNSDFYNPLCLRRLPPPELFSGEELPISSSSSPPLPFFPRPFISVFRRNISTVGSRRSLS